MNILEHLDELDKKIEYYNGLIARIENTLDEPFKYSRKKTTAENKEIANLKEIIGIPQEVKKNDTREFRTVQ